MNWLPLPIHPTPKVLRQFSGAWLVFFLAVGARQYFGRGHHQLGWALGVVALVVSGAGLIKPAAVRWVFIASMLLAFPIGWLISQIMLAFMFYGLMTPIGLFFRVRGRDLLSRNPAPNQPSFWRPKPMPQDVRNYFRQY